MGNTWCSGASVNAGTVLDRVISQASNKDECLLYRLANYKKGGELVDAYNTGGQAEVEKLIKEQFGVLMYNDGKGTIINRAEYLRWKFRDMQQVQIPIEASLSVQDPLSKWEDHQACWQMQYRGSLGETLLHVLIICDTKIHTRLARTLLKCFPNLSIDVVEGEEYLGASALHLAIAYFNNELVQDLVEAGANVEQRAIGSFFLPRDQQGSRPKKNTDYEGLAYLGEFPLAWAACCANESVYNLLLDTGANPDRQDSFGNMILHMVVVCDKLDMFGYALRHPKMPASNGISNESGLTPLTLACKLGRAKVFREMLELSAREFWRYSNITCSAYPLNALDTILPDGRTNWNSALFIILNGTKEEHLDMLDGGIIQRLLEEKWKTFARRQFLKRLVILMLHLIFLSGAVYLRPTDRNKSLLGGDDWQDYIRQGFEIGTVIGVLSYVIVQQGGEIKNQGLISFLTQLDPAKAIFLVSNILILACIPFRLAGDKRTEEAILVFAVPGSWFLLMFFAGAVRLTGPFVTMVYSMIMGDMFTFGIIYSIFLFGFSQSFYFLYKGFPGVKNTLYSSYPSTWMALFQITLGDYNYAELSHTTYPTLSKTVFTIFMILVPILLLNMLIAMMGNTYAHVIEQSEKEWMKQWAKIVVSLERAINQEDAKHYLQEYSIKLGPGDDPSTEQRGVMVIKSKSKTRAKQRKGAVANWKRVGKVTINELRKRNMTGEQLRRIMWDRASISTPVKLPVNPVIEQALEGTVTDQQQNAPANGGVFGGGLTAALDVMAFTHDLDLTAAVISPSPQSKEVYISDPFRDLVLSAEIDAGEDELSSLAEAAVQSVLSTKGTENENSERLIARKLSLEQSAALGLSDSDIFAEEPPLGQGSRARKVKSAQQRQRAENGNMTESKTNLLSWIYKSGNSSASSGDNEPPPPYTPLPTAPPVVKRKSLKRPKTAKPNRVAPEPEVPPRPGSSAVLASETKRQNSPPDPLEPWSTREIANMNAILAWQPSDQDSPSSKVLLLEGSSDESNSSSNVPKDGNVKVVISGNKGNAILVNPCQRGNPLLKHICSVPWEFEEGIVPDYIIGRTTCALFLSLRYYTLKPDYINDRLKNLGKLYDLRVLLVQVDMKDPYHALKHLTRICLLTDLTLMLAWSPEEAGKIIETYKIFEHKPPDLIMEKTESDTHNKMVSALTSIRAVNKTDASTLLANFGSLEKIIKSSHLTLSNCPGLGMRKAKNLHKILNTPFLKSEKMPKLGIAKYFGK